MASERRLTEDVLDKLERQSFQYFLNLVNPDNGLVADNTREGAPASIAAVGLALTAYPVGVERGYLPRATAIALTRAALRFFIDCAQGTGPDASGYHGFYYHFLDRQTGRRAWDSEISTIDTACLLGGALFAATYFDGDDTGEREVRALAHELYGRAEWTWAANGGGSLTHGWKPESGFLPYRWTGYSEALFLYIFALGSPTHPLPAESYRAWLSTYVWRNIYGYEHVYGGPLFMHQYAHLWLDLRGIQDEYLRAHGIDYFENSRRATYVQQHYAIHNPLGFTGYGPHFWGLTASEGPGDILLSIGGVERRFYDYIARAVPDGPDDGTIAPWAVMAALPFVPDIALPTLQQIMTVYPEISNDCGCKATVNPTYPDADPRGWISPNNYALNQGPVVVFIENYRSDMLWRLARRIPYHRAGLKRAGFTGGWLDQAEPAGERFP